MVYGKDHWKLFMLYTQSYFISIATILGSGVLGLPVTLSKSGFYPFLVTFFVNYVMQVLAICQMMEILQYARALLRRPLQQHLSQDIPERARLLDKETDGTDFETDIHEDMRLESADIAGSDEKVSENITSHRGQGINEDGTTFDPNFHAIGKLFLSKFMQPLFLVLLFFQFIVVTISYSLAGSEAFAQIFGATVSSVTPFFTWILGLIVILGQTVIKPAIAVLTLVKGSLLVSTVAVTMYSGAIINQKVSDDWAYTDKPMLMGLVALSGIILIMPMLFEKFQPVRQQMQGFRNAIIAGLTTCFILNILWCWAVLKVVPQSYASCNVSQSTDAQTNASLPTPSGVCNSDLNLEAADLNGEIATVPLTKIMLSQHEDMWWIAVFIQTFILMTITVSFLTVGSAMHHTVCGWVDDFLRQHERWKLKVDCGSFSSTNCLWHIFAGLICFSAIFMVAELNPKSFFTILERVSTMSTNLIYGIFIFIWIRCLRSRKYGHVTVSLETGPCLRYSHYLSLVFFSAALIYDIMSWSIGR